MLWLKLITFSVQLIPSCLLESSEFRLEKNTFILPGYLDDKVKIKRLTLCPDILTFAFRENSVLWYVVMLSLVGVFTTNDHKTKCVTS